MKKGTYRDSIRPIELSDTLQKLPGVTQAAVVMASELNPGVLSEAACVSPHPQTEGHKHRHLHLRRRPADTGGGEVVSVDWKPPAGGDLDMLKLLEKLGL